MDGQCPEDSKCFQNSCVKKCASGLTCQSSFYCNFDINVRTTFLTNAIEKLTLNLSDLPAKVYCY
jgi:hypothetical protein